VKCTWSGAVPFRVTKSEVRFAAGVVWVSVTRWVLPASQEIQLGRLTVTVTVTFWPTPTFSVGQTLRPRICTGSAWVCGAMLACTFSTVPPPIGIFNWASAVGLTFSSALDVVSSTAATTTAASGATTATIAKVLRNTFIRPPDGGANRWSSAVPMNGTE
jgi:hypothetical protein